MRVRAAVDFEMQLKMAWQLNGKCWNSSAVAVAVGSKMKLQSVVKEGGRKYEDRFFTIKCRQLLFHQVQFNCVLQEVGQSKQPGKQYKYKHILNIYILIYTVYIYRHAWLLGIHGVLNYIRGLRSHAVYNFLGVAIVPEGIEINCT